MLDSGQMPAEASDGYLAYIYFTLILDYLSVLVFTLDSGFHIFPAGLRSAGLPKTPKFPISDFRHSLDWRKTKRAGCR